MDHDHLIMKELDHIQAILGRFDTFFFLMKQVCLAGMAAIFATAVTNKLRVVPWFIFLIPLVFLAIETSFRFFYWAGYVRRIKEIRDHLNRGNNESRNQFRLYMMKSPSRPPTSRDAWCPEGFDLVYYGLWAAVALFAAAVLAMGTLK